MDTWDCRETLEAQDLTLGHYTTKPVAPNGPVCEKSDGPTACGEACDLVWIVMQIREEVLSAKRDGQALSFEACKVLRMRLTKEAQKALLRRPQAMLLKVQRLTWQDNGCVSPR